MVYSGDMAGRKAKPNLVRVNVKLDLEDQEWLKQQTEGRTLADGSKDDVSAYLRRLVSAERERVEALEALAEKRARLRGEMSLGSGLE